MTLTPALASVILIAGHGGSADHFATYVDTLRKQGYTVDIYATGAALKTFMGRQVAVARPFSLENLRDEDEDQLAAEIAKTCSSASMVITDVGHAFDAKIHQALKILEPAIPHYAYYDNPEPFVPGGYSLTAAKVMQAAEGIIFANEALASSPIYSEAGKEVLLANKKLIGIGYYPILQAEKVALRRETDRGTVRKEVLAKHGLNETGQMILAYFGGNNDEYFSKAFPAFLSLLSQASEQSDLRNFIVLVQQHPAAKAKNQDGLQVSAWLETYRKKPTAPKVLLSDVSSESAQVIADSAWYYQTSMGPQFVLAGIPAVQVGHETYVDILVRNHLAPSVTNARQLLETVQSISQRIHDLPSKELVLSKLGMRKDWDAALDRAIRAAIMSKR